tara:strand:+ start:155 stop:391 length:237 start_codon:yes stop_codon:yes gene_type:complete
MIMIIICIIDALKCIYVVDNLIKMELIEKCYKSIQKNLNKFKIKLFLPRLDQNLEIKPRVTFTSCPKEKYKERRKLLS